MDVWLFIKWNIDTGNFLAVDEHPVKIGQYGEHNPKLVLTPKLIEKVNSHR